MLHWIVPWVDERPTKINPFPYLNSPRAFLRILEIPWIQGPSSLEHLLVEFHAAGRNIDEQRFHRYSKAVWVIIYDYKLYYLTDLSHIILFEYHSRNWTWHNQTFYHFRYLARHVLGKLAIHFLVTKRTPIHFNSRKASHSLFLFVEIQALFQRIMWNRKYFFFRFHKVALRFAFLWVVR